MTGRGNYYSYNDYNSNYNNGYSNEYQSSTYYELTTAHKPGTTCSALGLFQTRFGTEYYYDACRDLEDLKKVSNSLDCPIYPYSEVITA